MFQSTKVIDGFSTCFRQWRAEGTHCKFIHGYGVSVKFVFQGELDERQWVADFGGFKRAAKKINDQKCPPHLRAPKDWLVWLLDHTTIVSHDDPCLGTFRNMETEGMIQLRILPAVGAERFAQYIGTKIGDWVYRELDGRVKLVSCEFREHEKNSAVYLL